MKATKQIISEQTDKAFEIVATTYANGGGNKEAKEQLKEVLYTVWCFSRQDALVEVGRTLKNLATKIEEDR